MKHASVLFIVMIFAFVRGTKEISESNVAKSTDCLDLLVSLLEGSFNSAEQALKATMIFKQIFSHDHALGV